MVGKSPHLKQERLMRIVPRVGVVVTGKKRKFSENESVNFPKIIKNPSNLQCMNTELDITRI